MKLYNPVKQLRFFFCNLSYHTSITKICKLILCCLLFSSCESFLDVELPDSQIIGETIFEDPATAEAALVDIYSQLRNNVLITGGSTGISNLLGNYADELTYYSFGLGTEAFYQNNLLASNTTVSSLWNNSYNLIYASNAILEGVENSSALSLAEKSQLRGEALFVRAFIHFYLLNLFGDIPYITTTSYTENSDVTRMQTKIVYEMVISDLQEAKALLSETYLTGERVRPNKWVASALLSRVYLYTENWTMAETEASSIINNTSLYKLVEDLNDVFLKNSTGTLWQFKPGVGGANTLEAKTFIFTSGPPPTIALNEKVIQTFELGDDRLNKWVGVVSDSTSTWYYVNKYKLNANTGSSEEYSILLRLAEQYLIRAEARARQGDLAGAREDLNRIRNRAGLEDIPAVTQAELIHAIIRERRVELFTELGHRWFDLKRTGRAGEILEYKPGWDSTDILWPIPESEFLVNSNLQPQNPGY